MVDFINHLNLDESAEKIERMHQHIQRMNLSELKFEMLTSNRSWRSGLQNKPVAKSTSKQIPKGSKVYISKQLGGGNV